MAIEKLNETYLEVEAFLDFPSFKLRQNYLILMLS